MIDEALTLLEAARADPVALTALADRLAESGDAALILEVLKRVLPRERLRLMDLHWTVRERRAILTALRRYDPEAIYYSENSLDNAWMTLQGDRVDTLATITLSALKDVPGAGKYTVRNIVRKAAALGITIA